jgi:hypothetical protein
MSPVWSASTANVVAVTRREFVTRTGTRGFLIATLILVVAAVVVGLIPVVIQYIDRNTSQTVAVYVGAADFQGDPVATLDALLNAPSGAADPVASPAAGATKDYTIKRSTDPEAGGRTSWMGGSMSSSTSSVTPQVSPSSPSMPRIRARAAPRSSSARPRQRSRSPTGSARPGYRGCSRHNSSHRPK